jgi:hypothetical protein
LEPVPGNLGPLRGRLSGPLRPKSDSGSGGPNGSNLAPGGIAPLKTKEQQYLLIKVLFSF